MGLTPLEGLVMGTRSGDLDPAMLDFLAAKEGLSLQEVEALLNKQSGLLGISGLTNDMRDLLDEEREHEDRRARLAIDIFCYRVTQVLGAYLAAMGGADAHRLHRRHRRELGRGARAHLRGLEWPGSSSTPSATRPSAGAKASSAATAPASAPTSSRPTRSC